MSKREEIIERVINEAYEDLSRSCPNCAEINNKCVKCSKEKLDAALAKIRGEGGK